MKISGIYKIINKVNGKYYVGSSENIVCEKSGRFKRHKKDLRKGNHHSIHLQRAWNKYSEQNFDFTVVEQFAGTAEMLLNLEQKYLDIAKQEKHKCYNMRFKSEGGDLRPEVIRKMSKSIRSRYKNDKSYRFRATKNCNTPEAIEKRSVSLKNKWKTNPTLWKNARIAHLAYFSNPTNLKNFSEQFKDKTIYTFKNTNTNEIYTGTQYDFRTAYNLDKGALNNLIKGRNKIYRFWTLSK